MVVKSSKIEVRGALWVAWYVFGEIRARVFQKIVTRMSPRYVKSALSRGKSGPSWTMLALRWRLSAQLEVFWLDLGTIFGRF